MGLPNMKRYSDEMTIDTEVGKGTTVTVKIKVFLSAMSLEKRGDAAPCP